jgi:hypothetical protein
MPKEANIAVFPLITSLIQLSRLGTKPRSCTATLLRLRPSHRPGIASHYPNHYNMGIGSLAGTR